MGMAKYFLYDEIKDILPYTEWAIRETDNFNARHIAQRTFSIDDVIHYYFSHLKHHYVDRHAFFLTDIPESVDLFGEDFVLAEVTKEESNLEMYQLRIGDWRQPHKIKLYAGLEELNEEWERLTNAPVVNYETLDGMVAQNDCRYENVETRYHETMSDWYPAHIVDGKKCVSLTFTKKTANIEIYTIHMGGDDDYSLSKQYVSKEEAYKEWEYLKTLRYVNRNSLSGVFFSN